MEMQYCRTIQFGKSHENRREMQELMKQEIDEELVSNF